MEKAQSKSGGSPSLTIGGVAFDLKLTLIIILAVLLPTIDSYHNLTGFLAGRLGLGADHFKKAVVSGGWDQVLLFFIIPMLVILVLFREKPSAYGFCFGKWREGLIWLAVIFPVLAISLWFVVRGSAIQDYYRHAFYGTLPRDVTQSHLFMIYLSLLYLVPWEFLWRGFFLFGLARVTGPGPAIFLQAVPFALLHLGKPELETLTTVFSGAGFGFVAWRTQSFLYPLLIHIFLLVATNLIASGLFG